MLNGVGVRLMLFAVALSIVSCGKPGVVEVQRIENSGAAGSGMSKPEPSEMAGACPSGWNCMDLSALGGAMDSAGEPVSASCSKGGIMPCNEADPSASCTGLSDPICVHLNVGGQAIVSCGQRCEP